MDVLGLEMRSVDNQDPSTEVWTVNLSLLDTVFLPNAAIKGTIQEEGSHEAR